MSNRHLVVAVTLGLPLFTACATTDSSTRPEASPADASSSERAEAEAPRATAGPVAFLDGDRTAYIDARTGQQMPFAQVLERLSSVQAVLVAEQHDQLAHHKIQARVIAGLSARAAEQSPQKRVTVGLEMVDWEGQGQLDRFVRNEIDADGLFVALDWERSWGHNQELYRDIFSAAREGNAGLVGLNAPRHLVRALAKGGVEGLSPEDKATLPEMNMDDAAHRAEIEAVFKHHHPPTKNTAMFERFYSAQVLWDESMAQNAAGALDAGADLVIVLAGTGHIAGYRGIPKRLQRRKPDLKLMTVIPVTLDDGDDPQAVAQTAINEGWGDIIVVVKPREVLAI